MTFNEMIAEYSPLTLTEAVRQIRMDEPFVLTGRLGNNVVRSPNESCVFEVEEGSYNLAPVGYGGDPAANVNIARRRKPYRVTPPQIFMKDRITATEINDARMIGQNPINMSAGDKGAAFNELIAIKQQGLLRLIDRRVEWFFAQALRGSVDYVSETGREFSHDAAIHILIMSMSVVIYRLLHPSTEDAFPASHLKNERAFRQAILQKSSLPSALTAL